MAMNMANIGHTRSKSLRAPADANFLKRPSQAPTTTAAHPKDTQHNGPTHLTLFLRNLRLLSLDVHPDWPEINAETFSTRDNQQNIKRRIQSVEWALYQLFCLWDPRDAYEKLAPHFPPLEPIQSIKLRGALYTCLDHLKKNGVLGRDAVLRKTMLDECKGERLEEVLSVFSTAVLKDAVQRDGGHRSVSQQLACEKFHYSAVPSEELSTMVLAHQVSLRRTLDKKVEKKAQYNGFAKVLREKDLDLARRKEELKKAIEEDESTEFVSRADTQMLQERVRKNWYGSNEWLKAVVHGDGPPEDGGLLSQPFEKVWKNVETGDLEVYAGKRRKGLLEQLDARVQEQNSRLEKWQSFGEQIKSQKKGDRKQEKKEKKVPANLDLGIGAHEELQLKTGAKEDQKTWAPKQENARLLDKLRGDLINVRKPKRVVSPAKRRVSAYDEQVSRSPSPELLVPRQQSMVGNNTPRKQDWAPMGTNNTPRAQDWEFNARNGRESVDLDGFPCPSSEPEHHQQEEDGDVDMTGMDHEQQDDEENSYEEINHEDAMDIDMEDGPVGSQQPERQLEEFIPPHPPSKQLRNPLALSRIENDIDYSAMAPPPASSKLRQSPSPYAAQNMDYADMAPPPAVSCLRASPSPYAAQNLDAVNDNSMPTPPIPRSLRKNTPSKSDLQARLRSSARKPSAKKLTLSPAAEKEAAPESPDLATKILISMELASPWPVNRHQPLSLAERTQQSMMSASKPKFDPAFSKPRERTPQTDSDDESLEQFTPRPAISRRSSATATVTASGMVGEPGTVERSMSLADRTRMTMSSLRNSHQIPGAPPAPHLVEESLEELLASTPRPAVASTPQQPMTLAERTRMSMRSVRPELTIKKSRQSIANLEEYDELQLVPTPQSKPPRNPKIRLSSVPFMDGMAEESASDPDFSIADSTAVKASAAAQSADLMERTRQSMKDLELVSAKAQLKRNKSVKVAAKKKRESYMPERRVYEEYGEEDTLKLIENAEEVPYEDAFRSRPKIAMSPNVSPVKGGWRDGSVSPFPI